MTVYEVYKRLHEKACEVKRSAEALNVLHPSDIMRLVDERTMLVYFGQGLRPDCETAWAKDERRAVKLLYADYCQLRDELVALLQMSVCVGP